MKLNLYIYTKPDLSCYMTVIHLYIKKRLEIGFLVARGVYFLNDILGKDKRLKFYSKVSYGSEESRKVI